MVKCATKAKTKAQEPRAESRKPSPCSQSIDCSSFPGLKRTAFPGGIETSAPVRGLRPIPVLRGRTLNTPKPRSSMRSPLARDFFMLSNTVSTASSAFVLVMPVLFTTSLMMSSLITVGSRGGFAEHHQVLDAKGHIRDCQRPAVSRKMTATKFQPKHQLLAIAVSSWQVDFFSSLIVGCLRHEQSWTQPLKRTRRTWS